MVIPSEYIAAASFDRNPPISISPWPAFSMVLNFNETRFSQAFARGKFNHKKWGKQRIVRELKYLDISKYNIDLALKEISESDYLTTFDALAEKRLLQLASEKNLQKKRKKFVDYLLYRGWESFLVYDKVRELIK